jgi:tetratricopeptide (TPR) repeat protein
LALARQLVAGGRFAEAVPGLREAAASQPDNAQIHVELGQLYLRVGQPALAIPPLRRALALDPRLATGYWRLGEALAGLGDVAGAIEALEAAVRLQPGLALAHYRLGLLHYDQGQSQVAADAFRRAARAGLAGVGKLVAEARALILEGREADAEPLLRRAVRRDPRNGEAVGLLGGALAALGDFAEAAKCYEAALALSPRLVSAYYDLTRCRRITPEDQKLLDGMAAALETGLDDARRAKLLLARGKAFEDLGRYEEAMAAFDAAAVTRARLVPFDLDDFEAWVEGIVARYDAGLLARLAGAGSADRTPVVIIGMPRSGTTLVEQIVSSHPAAAGAGELAFWSLRSRMVGQEAAGHPDAPFLRRAAADYLALLRSFSPTAARVADKDPWNFFFVGLIHLAFPHAAIIHCRRSPIDTAISIHQTHFPTTRAFPTGGEALVGYYKIYERLMAHWRAVLPAGRMLELDYETLASDPAREIPRIIDHIGLAWDEACLRPQDNDRPVRTASVWQVRQPITRASVERWRRYEPHLGPLAALIDR